MNENINQKILTISIPTWNRAALLKELLENLTEQINNCKLESKIEILISDNSSTDDTGIIANGYISKNTYIRYNKNESNIGLGPNVIKSMSLADGKYILLLGDDDRIREKSLPGIIDFLESTEDIGVIADSYCLKKNMFENEGVISLEQMLENFFWHIGNAGVFITRTSFCKNILSRHPYEYFNTSWPQTQMMIIGLFEQKNFKCYLKNFNILSGTAHSEVTAYNSYYLWRTCYYDLYMTIDTIKTKLDDRTVNAAKKYLSDNILQLFYNVLQCGVFLDNDETKLKTRKNISESIYLFSLKERFFLRIICAALAVPSPVSKTISNCFIFLTRGMKGIKKKEDFIRNEKLKKAKISKANNKMIREFQF